MTTFLADTFEKLANDPSWPWFSAKYKDPQGRVDMARLALMVVEGKISNLSSENEVMNECGINPSHYANVKKRVDEAKAT